jgi:hypothetical protein
VQLRASHVRNMARKSCVAQLACELRAGVREWNLVSFVSFSDPSECIP